MPVSLPRVRTAQATPAQPCPSKDTSVLNAMENGLRLMAEVGVSDPKTAAAVARYRELCTDS
jgi:hypothetical protein